MSNSNNLDFNSNVDEDSNMQATNNINQDQGADGGLQQTQTQPQIGPQPLVTDMTNNQVVMAIEGGQDSNMMQSSVS